MRFKLIKSVCLGKSLFFSVDAQCGCAQLTTFSGKNKMALISLRWSIFSNHAVMSSWEEMAIFVKHQWSWLRQVECHMTWHTVGCCLESASWVGLLVTTYALLDWPLLLCLHEDITSGNCHNRLNNGPAECGNSLFHRTDQTKPSRRYFYRLDL